MKKRTIALLLALISVFSLAGAAMPAAAVDTDPPAAADQNPADPGDAPETGEPADTGDTPETGEPADTGDTPETGEPAETDDPASQDDPAESEKPDPNAPWYQAAINYAVREGLLEGDENGNLNPEKNATRAETITILMRIFRNTQSKDLTQFTDMHPADWFYGAMSTAAAMNVLNGYPDRTMRPNAAITRQEAFALISRVFAVPQGGDAALARFPDRGSIADWAKSTIAGMVEQGYLEGDDYGMRPNDSITRAEIAQVLYNLKITITDDPEKIPASGLVVYHGKEPVDLDGFEGRCFLGGGCGSAPVVTGDAPKAQLYVRTDPGATVTLNGTVKETHLLSRNTRLTGSGNAGAVERAAVDCTVSCANGGVQDTYDRGLAGAKMYAKNVPALTPEQRSVTFTLTIDGSGCDYSTKPDGRWATLVWTRNGVQAGWKQVWLGYTPTTEQITISEPVWTPELSGNYDYHFILLYETDYLAADVNVPIRNYTAAEYQQLQARAYPYQIEVVRNQCTVLIYGQDKAGNYNILYRVCVCSPGYGTPLGTFRTPSKTRWGGLMGGVVGQYCTQIYKGVLFHSVYYHRADPSTLYASAYNQLGTICSHGCVRLTVADAKWIYDNCRLGTTVYVHDSSWLPVPKPTAQKIPYTGVLSGWDPTDPDPRNPWHA